VICYVICAEVAYDSYHQTIMVTLDKEEADKKVNDFNDKHDPECKACLPGGSDWDECFCKRYHMHTLPVKGIMPRIRQLIVTAHELGVMSELSGSSL
jgi:hypothetical protein